MPKFRYRITIHGLVESRSRERAMGTASRSIKRIIKAAKDGGLLPPGKPLGTTVEVFDEPVQENADV